MPTHPPVRRPATVVARSLLATAETVGFATYVHTQAGGHLPGPAQTLALSAAVFAGALALLSRQVRFTTIAAVVLGVQVVLHEGFSRLAPAGDPHAAMPGMPGMAHASPALDTRMLLNHAIIGLVTLLVLACQDQALHALSGLIQLLVSASSRVLTALSPQPASQPVLGLRSALLAGAPRRGPPRLVLLTP